MTVALLAPEQVQDLERQELAYTGIGQTAGGPPPGYARFRKAATLAHGTDFNAAAQATQTSARHVGLHADYNALPDLDQLGSHLKGARTELLDV